MHSNIPIGCLDLESGPMKLTIPILPLLQLDILVEISAVPLALFKSVREKFAWLSS
uniref:Uncharacterized protein n=1 Tax=Rhizophora mucronata TaxID=61149 RepID=A0A2P2NZB2_RHIMU